MARKRASIRPLQQLAGLCGVQSSYFDMEGRRKHASAQTLLSVLQAMGLPLESPTDAAPLLREQRLAPFRRRLEPVAVAWNGRLKVVPYCVPAGQAGAKLSLQLRREDGQEFDAAHDLERLTTLRTVEVEGEHYAIKGVPVPGGLLPSGYHTLTLEEGGVRSEMLIISSPLTAYSPPKGSDVHAWGIFLPLYALHSRQSWGAGDLTDFGNLIEWVGGFGGSVAATLPLLAAFLEEPFDPSPYVPASRLFWNEFYIDLARVPELEGSPEARALMDAPETRQALEQLRAQELVDYRQVMQLKRRVLEALARSLFATDSPRREALGRFLAANPQAGDYAAFRAACRRQHGSWHAWPEAMREGELKAGDFDEADRQYYLYTQWIVQEQLEAVSEKARAKGPGLYLDLPLGVNSDSYEVWREKGLFARTMSGGAPPDLFFSKGQCWGFPPLLPQRLREQKYQYWRRCLGQIMHHAGVLRVDHVMGLHRLFWVPQGMEATEGTYVQYPAEELYAILCLESHRNQTVIIGEDLGTVPRYVTHGLRRHNIHRMFVLQFNVSDDPESAVNPVGEGMVASLNTHDMAPFAGFWQGKDIEDQVDLGLIKAEDEEQARQRRQAVGEAIVGYFRARGLLDGHLPTNEPATLAAVTEAAYKYLGDSPAMMVLINLEDLWQELRPQNVPGTCSERPNWKHKARLSLEEFSQAPQITDLFQQVSHLRKSVGAQPRPVTTQPEAI